jgi:DNA invertase Pin-like site-specific DNA recombinase
MVRIFASGECASRISLNEDIYHYQRLGEKAMSHVISHNKLVRRKKQQPERTLKSLKGLPAISYFRFSHINQGYGSTLKRQRKVLQEVLDESGVILIPEFIDVKGDTTFTDRGKSATHQEHLFRGKLALLMRLLKEGRVKPGTVLIVEALDRLVRVAKIDALKLIVHELIGEYGLILVTGNNKQVWDRAAINSGKFHYLAALIDMAYGEANSFSERSMGGHDNRRALMKKYDPNDKKAETPVVTTPGWIERQGDPKSLPIKYLPIPQHVETVQLVFNLFCDGVAPRDIAIRLNQNLTTHPVFGNKHGDRWHATRIRSLLTDRRVLGYATVHELPPETQDAED